MFQRLQGGEQIDGSVISMVKGPVEKWLTELSQFDFFLALPGGYMPLCHNLVEAMAVGTVPVLSYSHWLCPPLIDGETCLTYRDIGELRSLLATIPTLPRVRIEAMRAAVTRYYDRFLSPPRIARFLASLEARSVRLYLNTESCDTLTHAYRQNPAAVVFRGGSFQERL